VKSRVIARRILAALERHYPDADTELAYRTPFELLVATILSAQSTDQRVNMVTPALFAKYPDARTMAAAEPGLIEPVIVSTGFFRQKCLQTWMPSSNFPASDARPRTSCSDTRSAFQACLSIGTCCVSPTGSAW
jgi:hypothetical protein